MRLSECVSADNCARTRHTQKCPELCVWRRHVAVMSCGNVLPKLIAAVQVLAGDNIHNAKSLAERVLMF